MHNEFVKRIIEKVKADSTIVGLAAGGSWIDNQMDEFSDIDLVLVTEQIVSNSFDKMYGYANQFGHLLNAFTGEHVGEKRLLICMYTNPLIHVDIKFVTCEEFKQRVENPIILWDKDGSIKNSIETTVPVWPELDYQWIEDRFWTWIHYATLKIGRGENFEALDFLSFLRVTVLAPLLQIKNGQLPRGLRKIEQTFIKNDLIELEKTISAYSAISIIEALEQSIVLYKDLRKKLFNDKIILRLNTEKSCTEYFYEMAKMKKINIHV
jgi:hypothetical protein